MFDHKTKAYNLEFMHEFGWNLNLEYQTKLSQNSETLIIRIKWQHAIMYLKKTLNQSIIMRSSI